MLLRIPTYFEKQQNNIREEYTTTKLNDMNQLPGRSQAERSFGTKKYLS